MSFDYFYGQQSDLFTFYRVPKVLFTNERFWNISADAKMLYGILLDRMSLSAKNGWIDKNGRVYIIFTIDEAKMALNCAEQKAIKLLSELEKKAGLIERKRQGLGKPNLIYVKNFISAVDSQLLNCENHNSGTMEITTQELPKSQCNNTDIKNTEFSDTDSIFPSGNGGMMDENDRYQEYFDYFSDQLSMDLLKKDYPYDSEMPDNILELIVETVCTKRPLIRIGAEERPAEIVRSRFMKLNVEHIRYVMDCFKENTTKIRNIRQYMLTTIYNAPTTIDTYLCWQRYDDPLRKPHFLCFYRIELLATAFLLLRQNQKLKEGWRLSAKLDRIGADLEKARKKRAEWDARVKDLERRYRENENSEIHEMVHAANLTPDQLSELLRMFAADMALKPDTINTMNKEEPQNEI